MRTGLILWNAVTLRNFRMLAEKLSRRVEPDTKAEMAEWIKRERVYSTEEFCQTIDAQLFRNIEDELHEIEIAARQKLSRLGVELGGPGDFALLYFLILKYKPTNIVETGVAAGWSSLAMLEALWKNGNGTLYSSDLPYFRLRTPRKYVGVLVEDSRFRKNWHLWTQGDRRNLPLISEALGKERLDLFHYDSDKSYAGRVFALSTLREKFDSGSVVIFDDIGDNNHFKNWVENTDVTYSIIASRGRFVGVAQIR